MPKITASQQQALDELREQCADLTRAFALAGYPLYLVGGPVRDALLGTPVQDFDFTTPARPDEIARVLRPEVSAIWDIGKEFGTIGGLTADGKQVEITTFRSDVYTSETRKPVVAFGDTLEGDLIRRDFKFNAMALNMVSGAVIDPFGGFDDLLAGVIDTPGSAEVSFSDDPLRMMRAARFVSQLSCVPSTQVVAAMRELAPRLAIVSAERCRDELSKLLLTNNPRDGLNLLVHTSVAEQVIPEIVLMMLERDEHNRHKDVYEHTLTVIEQSIALEKARGHEPDLIGRLAALFHDVGKPRTRKFEPGGKVSFHHHDVVGAKITRKRLTELRYPVDVVKAVSRLVELHLRFHGYSDGEWTDSAVRRYVRDAGNQLERLHILTRADCTTRNQRKANRLRTAYEQLEWRIDALAQAEELAAIRPELNGAQIMEILGLKPGPQVGQAYQFLLNLRLDEGPLGPEVVEQRLRAWWSAQEVG